MNPVAGPPPALLIFSPLPPMPTGIGDYVFELLPLLAAHYTCTVVAEDGAGALAVPPGVALLRLSEYLARERQLQHAVHLYMIGNNPDHVFMLPILDRHPGVVVLHDPGLHHLLDCATASLGESQGYCDAIEADYGAPGRLLAEQWRQHGLRDRQLLDGMPMLRALLRPARHVIVHSRFAAHKALAHAPATPVTIAPHQFMPPPGPRKGADMRRRLGIRADELVFLSLGFVSHIKRIDTALRALARVAGRLPPFRYVIAGEHRRDELDVESLARSLHLESRICITGYVADADFFPMIDMADILINLRHPVGGETSGTLIRALGRGACVVTMDTGPFAEIPSDAAIRLGWGPRIESDLGAALLSLATEPAARRRLARNAARHIGLRNHPSQTLAAYRAAIDQAAVTPDRRWDCRAAFCYHPVQAAPPADAPFWRLLDAAPALEPPGDIWLRGGEDDLAALRALGHHPVRLAPDWSAATAPPASADLIVLRLQAADPMLSQLSLPAQLNRLLRLRGILVLQMPDTDHVLARHASGVAAWQQAGFRVDLAEAALPPGLAANAAPGFVWRAVKVSNFIAQAA